MSYADPIHDPLSEPDGASVLYPRPINGDASFGSLLGHQRQAQAELDQSDGLDEETAMLLPLMLSLARLSARALVQGAVQ